MHSFYHEFDNTPIQIDYDQAIEELERLFCKAVERCFEKDLEYGYKNHLVDISGGYDCKLVSWTAKKLGYGNILNMTYSKFNSDEMNYAIAAAIKMGNEIFYKPLDDCRFFLRYKEMTQQNCGLCIFCASTGADSSLGLIDFSKYGLEHTGLLGDVIVGSYCHSANDINVPVEACLKGISYFPDRKAKLSSRRTYRNYEQFALYLRGMQGITNSCFLRKAYTSPVSAFMDLDFFQFCLSLPVEWRIGHRLYRDWLNKMNPGFLEMPSTSSPSAKKRLRKVFASALGPFKMQVKNLLCKNRRLTAIVEPVNSMNPVNYWFYLDGMEWIGKNWQEFYNAFDFAAIPVEAQKETAAMFQDKAVLKKAAAITFLAWHEAFARG